MKYVICSTLVAFACLFFANSASAIDGRTAVGMCIDSKIRCAWSVNSGGEIDICTQHGCVYCPSATEECTMAKKRPRPSRYLPDGAVVSTVLGDFTVKRSNRIDQLIKPKVVKRKVIKKSY
jgi:hypothetical protein